MSTKALLFLIVSGLSNLAGAWLYLMRKEWEHESLRLWIGVGAGFMLAVAIAEMFPEALERSEHAAFWTIGGFLFVHVFEHVLTPHFHYGHEGHGGLEPRVGITATLGLAMHSLTDGVAIVAALQVDPFLGWVVLAAMVWHKIPGGFTAASVTGATGGSRAASFAAGSALAVATIVAGLLYSILPAENWVGPALGVSAGSLIYVAGTDLLPEVNKRRSLLAPLGVVAGVGFFYLTHLLMEH